MLPAAAKPLTGAAAGGRGMGVRRLGARGVGGRAALLIVDASSSHVIMTDVGVLGYIDASAGIGLFSMLVYKDLRSKNDHRAASYRCSRAQRSHF